MLFSFAVQICYFCSCFFRLREDSFCVFALILLIGEMTSMESDRHIVKHVVVDFLPHQTKITHNPNKISRKIQNEQRTGTYRVLYMKHKRALVNRTTTL